MQLTQKEKYLLEDQKSHEEMCIKKYTNYSDIAHDPELKQLFQKHGQQEQQHLDTINQILNGTVPSVSQGQQGQQQNQQNQQNQAMQSSNQQTGKFDQADSDLCQDLLMAEKYVSGTYDTAIFEFRDTNIRKVLNHIQKEEQQHGEDIFNYMQSHGMYNPQ